MPHTGWVHYDSAGRLTLYKSPYRTTNVDDRISYVIPADLRPAENEFVTLEVEKPIRRITQINRNLYCNFKDVYTVTSITKSNINEIVTIQRPYLDSKEFQYRLTQNWKGAENDNLDFSIAMQILSCPSGIHGTGGIGTWTISRVGGGPKSLIDLKRTISHLLPIEFMNSGNIYRYNFIDNSKALLQVENDRRSGKIPEISYNYLAKLPPKEHTWVQIPTKIENSEFKPGTLDLDQDVLEYLLTALLTRPVVKDFMISKIESTIRKVYRRLDFETDALDPLSTLKIANAICRLDFRTNLDEDNFDNYSHRYDEVMYNFMDSENLINPYTRETYNTPQVDVLNLSKHMTPMDNRVLRAFAKEHDEGKTWVTQQDVEKYFDPGLRYEMEESIQKLRDLGRILMSPRGFGYKIFWSD